MLHYETSGQGSHNLVLLHGFMENSEVWNFMKPFLSDQFKIITIDLPGHGQSESQEEILTMGFMAKEVHHLIDHLNLTTFHLLGHSMGGYVSLAYAELYPEKLQSLTLFFSTFLEDTLEKKDQRRKSFRVVKDAFKHYVNVGIPNLFAPDQSTDLMNEINFAKKIALEMNSESVIAALKGMIERTNKTDVLKVLDIKIILIAGKYDTAVNSEVTFKNLPKRENIKFHLLDCGHMGQLEQPDLCAEIINTELL